MADRYTLPPSMGGHECEVVWLSGTLVAGVEIAKVRYKVDSTLDGFEVTSEVLASWLTPVKPPPVEPPHGTPVVAGGHLAWRIDHPIRDNFEPERWWQAGSPSPVTWTEVCSWGDPVVYVPDPLAEPVQLPWTGGRFAVHVNRGLPRPVRIEVLDPGFADWCNTDEARNLCRAVWAAANQADKAGETT